MEAEHLLAIMAITVGVIVLFVISKQHVNYHIGERFYNIPDLHTSIGGRKGKYVGNPSYGMYDDQYKALARGDINHVSAFPTLIDPSQVGFSYNSFVNRNTYADFYNNIGERRRNPNFKFITRFKGIELHPARYTNPEYSFASI